MKSFRVQLWCELQKLFGRKRTYLGFGVFLAVELLMMGLLHLEKIKAAIRPLIEQTGFDFNEYYSGLTLAFFSRYWTTFLIGSLYLALVAGDIVAKEAEDGTLRMIFCRRVSRGRLLAVKFAACVIYSLTLMFFIGITALLVGFLWEGAGGGLVVIVPQEHLFVFHDFWPGLDRYLASLFFQALTYLSITSMAFMLSCCNVKPVSATIGTLSVFFSDMVFRSVPYFKGIEGYFLTTHMIVWSQVFQPHIPWDRFVEDYALLLGLDATWLWIGWLVFQQRDFKA